MHLEEEAETPSIEAHRIAITYGFDANGTEYVSIEPEEDIGTILLLGILEFARYRVLHQGYEDEEDEDD